MIKTIKQILKEGVDFPAKFPKEYFSQKMYSEGELIKERIKGRQEVVDNSGRFGLVKMTEMVQCWVWTRTDDGVKVLVLHRHKNKGAFWQPVCGRVEDEETLLQAVEREIEEETSLSEFEVGDEFFKFTFDRDYLTNELIDPVTEHVFSAEVQSQDGRAPEVDILNNFSDEHDMWRWVSVKDALKMLKWNDNKLALGKFMEREKL